MPRLLLATTLLLCSLVSSLWHNYNQDVVDKGESAECRAKFPDAKSLTALLEMDRRSDWKLWPNLVSKFDTETGETLYGMKQAMEVIWKNQHPEDCSKAQFLIAQGWPQGFGSEVHVLGVGLAVALNTKRVFIMNPDGAPEHDFLNNTWQVQNPFCRSKNSKSALDCYFESWTHCKPEDALGPDKKRASDFKVHQKTYFSDTDFQNKFNETQSVIKDVKTVLFESRGDAPMPFPDVLHPIINCSPVISSRYWWRAVAAAYMLRPRPETVALLDKHRPQVKFRSSGGEDEQCISIYIRRGDKHVEMKPVHTKYYLETAKALWDAGMVPGPGGSQTTSKGSIFIGSEDADAIDQAKAWGAGSGFKILYSNLFDRRADVSTGLDWIKQVKMKRKNQFKHHDLEYFSMLHNLDLHLRCAAFVCTLPSNFCRVIDELRAVYGKITRPFAELGIPGCPPNNNNGLMCEGSPRFVNYY